MMIKDGRITIYMVNPKSRTLIKTWWINTCNLKHRVRANKYTQLMWGRDETMEDYDYNHYQDYQDWLDSLEILC